MLLEIKIQRSMVIHPFVASKHITISLTQPLCPTRKPRRIDGGNRKSFVIHGMHLAFRFMRARRLLEEMISKASL